MKATHVELLRCLECNADLELAVVESRANGEVELGVLRCRGCRAGYPILNGVAVFFGADVVGDFLSPAELELCERLGLSFAAGEAALTPGQARTRQSMKNWDYQWGKVAGWTKDEFEKGDFKGAAAFHEFIPIAPEEFRGRRVMVWCGASGREAYHIAKYEPSLLILNDLGLGAVPALAGSHANLLLVRCDMLRHPLKPEVVDISICDHALQHLVDWRQGFQSLVKVLRPGGLAAICVYSHENNGLMTKVIEPSKRVLHLAPLPVLKQASVVPAVLLSAWIHLLYRPLGKVLPPDWSCKLPLYDHLMFWSHSDLRFLTMACFDLMHAPVSYHFRRDEVQSLAEESKLEVSALKHTHGTLWSLVARRPASV